jgi:hypothetical protein
MTFRRLHSVDPNYMARTNPKLWESSKAEATRKMGGHSARAMQLAGKIYKEKGGGYTGAKTTAQKSLTKWTKEEWGTKSGKPSVRGKDATGERYLPKKAIKALSSSEYASTTAAKRKGTKAGNNLLLSRKLSPRNCKK